MRAQNHAEVTLQNNSENDRRNYHSKIDSSPYTITRKNDNSKRIILKLTVESL